MKLKRTTPAKSRQAGCLLDTLETYLDPGSTLEQGGSALPEHAAEPDAELDRCVVCALPETAALGCMRRNGMYSCRRPLFESCLCVWPGTPASLLGFFMADLEPGSLSGQAGSEIRSAAEADAEVVRWAPSARDCDLEPGAEQVALGAGALALPDS